MRTNKEYTSVSRDGRPTDIDARLERGSPTEPAKHDAVLVSLVQLFYVAEEVICS